LTALDNGVKGGKWFSLIDKVCRRKTLEAAYQKVASNRGACGIDKVSVKKFARNKDCYLSELEKELKEGTYNPMPVKRINIPKGDGKTRPLGIPAVKDRIVQTALMMVIEPIFENEFLETSYGFRPKRGCKDALRVVDKGLKSGLTYVVDADITSYFDSIPHEELMKQVREKVSDGKVLELIEKFLNQEIMEGLSKWTPINGTPQGAVLSPLLANIYLHPLDKEMTDAGFCITRYADDFVILCRNQEEAEEALAKVQKWVGAKGLKLHPDKTKVGNCIEEGKGFEFLGYRFESGKRYVRKKSMKKLYDKVREKTKRRAGKSLQKIIGELNPTLRGWFEYFKHADKFTFRKIDGFIRRRLRSLLYYQKTKRSIFGKSHALHKMWTNAFFAEQGLFTLQRAFEIASQSR